jgi:hypothetical protein
MIAIQCRAAIFALNPKTEVDWTEANQGNEGAAGRDIEGRIFLPTRVQGKAFPLRSLRCLV